MTSYLARMSRFAAKRLSSVLARKSKGVEQSLQPMTAPRQTAMTTHHKNGTYDAPIQLWSDESKSWIGKFNNSTFFPADWSKARIMFEVTEAFKAARPKTGVPGVRGTSPGGVDVQFHWDSKNDRTTFYPLTD